MAVASLAPLRHRSYLLAWSSAFVSSVGTWMQSVALGVYLTVTTHDPLWLGLVTLAGWLPSVIGSPLGGVMADRVRRERWIQGCNLVMAATSGTLALAALSGHLHPVLAVELAVGEGLASSAAWPAWQSLLRDLVDESEVLAAVSLASAQFNLGRVVGPVLAALALAIGSPGVAFAINAGTFVVVVVAFAFVRSAPRERRTDRPRPGYELREGARRAWAVAGCRQPIIAVSVVSLTLSPFIALIPAFAIDVLHAGRYGTSILVTAQGVGAVVGALAAPGLAQRTSRSSVLAISLVGAVASALAYATASNIEWAAVALTILGACYVGVLTGLNTSVQLHAPTRERARIIALYQMAMSIAYPLGALVQSAEARHAGVRLVSAVGAGTLGLVAALALVARPRSWGEMTSTPERSPRILAD